MYKRILIAMLSLCLAGGELSAEQAVPPELRNDITEVVAQDIAARLQRLRSGLAEALNQTVFEETLASVLRSGQPVEEIANTRCPMAADIANGVLKRFAPRDFDVEAALSRIRELAAQPAPATDAEKEKQWESYMKLYNRMAAAYRPVLRLREADREREILAANAGRAGVTVLPNGVQMELEPGDNMPQSINRGTRETGVAFYTRTTRRMSFEELPEAIRSMAAHIPPARSWTFWVPAETTAALEAEKQRKKAAEDARRREMMSLLGGEQTAQYSAQSRHHVSGKTAKNQAGNKLPEPMLKIKVWADDENAPVQTLPDVVQDML